MRKVCNMDWVKMVILAIEIIDEDVYKVQVKQIYTDNDYSILSFQILKDI